MSDSSKHAAQHRADDIRVFRDELARLDDEGALVLDDAQKTALASHHARLLSQYAATYDVDLDAGASQLSAGMRIASSLGALALSASIFFLFYQVWGNLSTPVQLIVIIGSAVGSFTGTMMVHRRDPSGYFTNVAAMIAFACFVIDLSMLGQIFNLTPTDNALLAWGALAMVLAYACDLRLMLIAGILCLLAFGTTRIGSWTGIYWVNAMQRPENYFLPAIGVFITPFTVNHDRHGAFPGHYRTFGAIAVLLPVFILSHWGDGSYLAMDSGVIEGLYQVAGFVLSATLIAVGVRRGWSDAVNVGLTAFVVFFYAKIFDWWWELLPKSLFFLVLGLTAVLILLVLRRFRRVGLGFRGAAA